MLDPLLAAATGVYVLWSGMRMISSSVGGLMDAAPEPAVINRIRELVAESAVGALEAHDLRTRHAGRLTLPGVPPRRPGHHDGGRIPRDLRPDRGRRCNAEMDHLVVTIHVEPPEKAKQHGVPVL